MILNCVTRLKTIAASSQIDSVPSTAQKIIKVLGLTPPKKTKTLKGIRITSGKFALAGQVPLKIVKYVESLGFRKTQETKVEDYWMRTWENKKEGLTFSAVSDVIGSELSHGFSLEWFDDIRGDSALAKHFRMRKLLKFTSISKPEVLHARNPLTQTLSLNSECVAFDEEGQLILETAKKNGFIERYSTNNRRTNTLVLVKDEIVLDVTVHNDVKGSDTTTYIELFTPA